MVVGEEAIVLIELEEKRKGGRFYRIEQLCETREKGAASTELSSCVRLLRTYLVHRAMAYIYIVCTRIRACCACNTGEWFPRVCG